MSDNDDESAMQKFEDLATRLFSIAKEELEEVEEVAKEAVDEFLKPAEKPEPDE